MANVCQYWRTDEPGQCPHWDSVGIFCSYVGPGGSTAEYFPFCNLLGTAVECSTYAGTSTQSRCVLPDPTRHVVNRATGRKWVELPAVDETGLPTQVADFSAITGYNNGQCDGQGTGTGTPEDNTICAGYSPYIMQFGVKQPDDKDGSLGIDASGFSALSGTRLPLGYEIYNLRSRLGKCHWWEGSPTDFEIDENTGKVGSITFKCVQADEIVQNYSGFKFDKTLNMLRPPCNGVKPECPHYTGTCWKYCVDSKMKQGDKVLAEQILELRWKIKKESWDVNEYYTMFEEPEIYAWLGTLLYVPYTYGGSKTTISARRTYISDFDTFKISYAATTMGEGLQSEDYKKRYPTLVKSLKELVLSPIIRNKFDRINNTNIFETNGRFEHENVLLVGDIFFTDGVVYGINLSDPDLTFLPIELQQFDSMYAIEKALGTGFQSFYDDFVNKLELMKDIMPDKLHTSEMAASDYMFYIPVKTFWGRNKIIVLCRINGQWRFDGIEIYKPYVGGVVGQTLFELLGDGGEVPYLPAYENDFGAYNNANGKAEFRFFPLTSDYSFGNASAAYAYIDGVRKRLDVNPALPAGFDTYEFTYKLYRSAVAEDLNIEYKDMRFFGNAGFGFIFLDDESRDLNTTVKPWEVDEAIFLAYPDGYVVEMEIYEKCTDRLPVNCFIVRPKDINNFKMVCEGTYLNIPKLYVYERKTFESQYLEAEVVGEDFIAEDDVVQYRTNLELSGFGNDWTLTKFGYESLMAAIVYKGPTGRIIGQTKTKLLTSVRQPFCRDVEIRYSWKAPYRMYKLLPEYECYGKTGEEDIGNGLVWKGYTPPCGDHELSFFTGLGPMWYPYNDCEEAVRYNINGLKTEFDINFMEIFNPDVDPPHGSHDLRMLGPADHYGETGDVHSSIWSCLCDWTFINSDRRGANVFSGYANYRGGMDELAKIRALRNGGSLPKFGNVYRDFLRSYRSMENVDYYYWNGSMYIRRRKWVPLYEFYSASFSELLVNYPYLLHSYSDYESDNSTFIHPMGCLLAKSDVEGVPIEEKFDIGPDGSFNRYRFEEVFRTHSTLAGIYYPMPKNPQQALVGLDLVDIMPWYTYKDYPGDGGGTTKSIQWAWQEYWLPVKRQEVTSDSFAYFTTVLKGVHPTTDRMPISLIDAPYIGDLYDNLSGMHAFLNIEYPNYIYDGVLKEHRLVCDEGTQTVEITPPELMDENPGNYGESPIWHIRLNEGPNRCFDQYGAWLTTSGIDCNTALYQTCTNSPWLPYATVFDTGYDSTIPDPNRTITYSDTIPNTYEYYQRGLNISVKPTSLGFLPKKAYPLGESNYEMRISSLSTCDEGSGSDWAVVEDVEQFYPASTYFGVTYCTSSNELIMTMKFNYSISIGAVGINFSFGAKKSDDVWAPSTIFSGTLYHLPGISMYRSDDDVSYTPINDLDSVKLATKVDTLEYPNCFYKLERTPESIRPFKYLKIIFRLMPTNDEVEAVGGDFKEYYYTTTSNKITINYINVYYNDFMSAIETIKTYERLYNISYGSHGDFPPHGYDSTGSLLYIVNNDKSTVYQIDTLAGVVGMSGSSLDVKSMNKVRGRIMKACHPDKEPLQSGDIFTWETEQKKIHDDIAIKSGSTSIVLSSAAPPNMDYLLKKARVNFPAWSCRLTNSLVSPLASIYPASPYSPCGHTYIRLYEEMRREVCAKRGAIFVRIVADRFDYGFKHYCGDESEIVFTQVSAIDVYFRGIGRLLVNPMLYVSREISRRQEIADRIRAASYTNPSRYTFPSPVDPIY